MTHYGFNFLWMYNAGNGASADGVPFDPRSIYIAEDELDFVREMGCNFARIPLDYRFWSRDFRYSERDEAMLRRVDDCVRAVTSRGMHCSLNVHRAPGYCINDAETERHNLWRDAIAQDAFVSLWRHFAKRYSAVSAESLSFDLLNEPPDIGMYGMTREIHACLMRRAAAAIREVSPNRPITLDGLGGGNIAMPELADLGVTMSTRGYQPMAVTHYRAAWCAETKGLPSPVYPGTEYAGKSWNRSALMDHYKPWKRLSDAGVNIHVGEFGCYNKVDNALALAWFDDVFSVFNELGWGYSMWNFQGDFGIAAHNRPGTRWEKIRGFKVDRELYELFIEHMKKV
jgi:aryl-phospho-beta-D-glucosidase BglC (GH1 family)